MGMVSGILPVVGVPLPLVSLRRHRAGDAVPRVRHPDEHPQAPQAGADVRARGAARRRSARRALRGRCAARRVRGTPTAAARSSARRRPRSDAGAARRRGAAAATTSTTARATARRPTSTRIPDARAARRAAAPLRQQSLRRVRPDLRARARACGRSSSAALASWYGRKFHGQTHLERRDLRHVRDDRRAPDAADPELRARHQLSNRPLGGRARQRPRPVPARPRDRPVVRRRVEARLRRAGQRAGRGRARARRDPTSHGRRPPPARTACAGAARARDRRAAACRTRRVRRGATRVPVAAEPGGIYLQLGAFSARDNAESFRARARARARVARPADRDRTARTASSALHVGPYRTRAEAATRADRRATRST